MKELEKSLEIIALKNLLTSDNLSPKIKKIISAGVDVYKNLSITDGLTNLYNKRHFDEILKNETARTKRHKRPLSLIMLDIDYFKKYNDTYGHLEGDEVLTRVGGVIKNSIRDIDSAYRYGGEEFVVILPETLGNDAVILAERVRKSIEEQRFFVNSEEIKNITASFGVTQYQIKESIEDFVKRADKNMYHAKELGRNRVYSAEI